MSDSRRDFDFIVIGSGFGGSVTAHRLTEKGYRVAVMEMGRRWTPDNLPSTNWLIWRWFWRPRLALRGFFNMEYFKHVVILHGCAVGGGSITYANTMLVPQNSVWDNGSWAGLADWPTGKARCRAITKRPYGRSASSRTVSSARPTTSSNRRPTTPASAIRSTGPTWRSSNRPKEKTAASLIPIRISRAKVPRDRRAPPAAAAWWDAATMPRTPSIRTISISPKSTARGFSTKPGLWMSPRSAPRMAVRDMKCAR